MFKKLLEILVVIVFGILLGMFVLEWMAGCGETYVDANGVRHQNECVFIPLNR